MITAKDAMSAAEDAFELWWADYVSTAPDATRELVSRLPPLFKLSHKTAFLHGYTTGLEHGTGHTLQTVVDLFEEAKGGAA